MIRTIAVLLMTLSPMAAGFYFAAEQRRALRELEGFQKLIAHIRYEISAFRTKQSELFDYFECEALEENGFLERLRSAAARGGEHCLWETLSEARDVLSIGEEPLRLLTEYARQLGRRDAEEEQKSAQALEDALGEQISACRTETQNRVRLYRAFGVVAAFCVLLVIL